MISGALKALGNTHAPITKSLIELYVAVLACGGVPTVLASGMCIASLPAKLPHVGCRCHVITVTTPDRCALHRFLTFSNIAQQADRFTGNSHQAPEDFVNNWIVL